MIKLRTYQQTGVKFIRSLRRSLLADDMGVGKTVQAARAFADARRLLVVCPGFLRSQWIKALAAEGRDAVAINSSDDLPLLDLVNTAVVSYALACPPHERDRRKIWDAVIVDEAHYLKNPASARTRAIMGWSPEEGFRRGVLQTAECAVFLTGTPIRNNAAELFTLAARCADFKLLKRHRVETYPKWMRKFCVVTRGGWNGATELQPREVRNEDLLKEILGTFWLRRTREEVLPELPDKTRMIVDCEIDASMNRLIKRENQILEQTPLDRAEDIFSLVPLATLRREIGVAKVSSIIKHLLCDLEQVRQIAVFPYHREVIARFGQLLDAAGISNVTVHGGMSDNTRVLALRAFERGLARVFLGQLQAAGVGLDGMQSGCSLAYLPEAWTVLGDVEQAVGRLHRFGQRNAVLYKCFQVPGSLDARLWAGCWKKEKHIQKIL